MLYRQALFLHRQALLEQLKESEDPALVLHLTSVLLFQASTQCMLHAPGRCVPQIINILTGRIPTVSLSVTTRNCIVYFIGSTKSATIQQLKYPPEFIYMCFAFKQLLKYVEIVFVKALLKTCEHLNTGFPQMDVVPLRGGKVLQKIL